MYCLNLGKININLQWLDDGIRRYIPAGRESHKQVQCKFDKIKELYCLRDLKDTPNFNKQIGTLGGGNHFIELDQDEDMNTYLVIHTGSRNMGKQVAEYYQNLAIKLCSGYDNYLQQKQQLISDYKKQNKKSEIQKALKELDKSFKFDSLKLPRDLCYLTGEYKDKYLHDMKICQKYAVMNREIIADIIINKILQPMLSTKIDVNNIEKFQTIHNYLNFEDNIIRKGAVSAYKGEKLIIPINMRDGSLICVGKGNPEWNYSAPHGAGRIMSRSKAKENVSMVDYLKSMVGVFTTSVNQSTIDESPFVYKPMQEIIDNIEDTVDVIKLIKPIYNFKASE